MCAFAQFVGKSGSRACCYSVQDQQHTGLTSAIIQAHYAENNWQALMPLYTWFRELFFRESHVVNACV